VSVVSKPADKAALTRRGVLSSKEAAGRAARFPVQIEMTGVRAFRGRYKAGWRKVSKALACYTSLCFSFKILSFLHANRPSSRSFRFSPAFFLMEVADVLNFFLERSCPI
jgi:hypothetical protein